jgi:hypothetical protein
VDPADAARVEVMVGACVERLAVTDETSTVVVGGALLF